MTTYVLDSHALLAFCQGEERGKAVADILKHAACGEVHLSVCVVNWGEMYYIVLRGRGEEGAQEFCSRLGQYPMTLVDANLELTIQAARYKASHKMSFADAFAAALAKFRNAELVTGDEEFRPLAHEIKIRWI